MSGGAWALLATLITTVGAGLGALWKFFVARGSQRIDEVEKWQRLQQEARDKENAAMLARINRMQARIDKMESVIVGELDSVVSWIDRGADPPPPRISSDLRGLIYVLRNDWTDDE